MRGLIAALAALISMSAPLASKEIQVVNDPGGRILDRKVQIEIANRTNARIQIVGDYCNSSCTMLLGADDVCVSSQTLFGFHGPYRVNRTKMTAEEFDKQSASLSNYYPHQIRNWFMSEARYAGPDEYLYISGAYLISLGVQECV